MVVARDARKTQRGCDKRSHVAKNPVVPTLENIRDVLKRAGIDVQHAFSIMARDETGSSALVPTGHAERRSDQVQYSAYQATPASQGSTPMSTPPQDLSENMDDEMSSDDQRVRVSSLVKPKAPRVFRPARRRRDQPKILAGTPTYIASGSPMKNEAVPDLSSASHNDDGTTQRKHLLHSFPIGDSEKVERFLIDRLKRIQQLADKKIAKAWIKGICPNKQAKFPYQNNKLNEGEEPVVPGWWPDKVKVCRFVEPDHIKRDERVRLCVHLLRLRPSPEELNHWNNSDTEPNPTHVNEGWTAFLAELAGPEIFDELPKESPKRAEKRRDFMSQMYACAAMEEQFVIGARDGTDMFTYEHDEETVKRTGLKRSRRSSIDSSASLEVMEPSLPPKRTKLRHPASLPGESLKRNPHVAMPSEQVGTHMDWCGAQVPEGIASTQHRGMQYSGQDFARARTASPAEVQAQPMQRHASELNPTMATQDGTWRRYPFFPNQWSKPDAPSVCAPPFPVQDSRPTQPASSAFAPKPDYSFPQFSHDSINVQVNPVLSVPQPEFHALPDAHMFSQASLMSMPMPTIAYQQPSEQVLQQSDTYPSTMPPNQYFMVPHDASIADFHPQSGVSEHAFDGCVDLAERHFAPMPFSHGLPATHGDHW